MPAFSTVDFSWIGNSYLSLSLSPGDAERELTALREQPILNKDLNKTAAAGAKRGRRVSEGGKLPWRSPSLSSAAIGPPVQVRPASIRGITTDLVIKNCQEEARVLHQALENTPDYKQAQRSMKSLSDLQMLLWEAFNAEGIASAHAETIKLKAAQEIERASLEAKLKRRENGLRDGCRRQVDALRRRHVVRLKAAQAAVPGTRRNVSTTNVLSAATIPPNAAAEQSGSEIGEERANPGSPRTLGEGEGESGVVQRSSPRFPTVAAAVTGHAHTKKQIELREQLARHLAAAGNPEIGHRHLQDAARVVKVIEKLQMETRQEAEVRKRYTLNHPENDSLFQQQLQAETIQREKHQRLLRSHERSRVETLRLLSARNHRALGRLNELLQVENRRRRNKLRSCLAAVKSEVKRAWTEHSSSRGIPSEGSSKPERRSEKVRTSAETSKLGGARSLDQVTAMATRRGLNEKKAVANRVSVFAEREVMTPTAIPAGLEVDGVETNVNTTHEGNDPSISPSLGHQQAGGIHGVGQAFCGDRESDCEDADGVHKRKALPSRADRSAQGVGGWPPGAASNIVEPEALDSRVEGGAEGRTLRKQEVLDRARASSGFGETTLGLRRADKQLRAPVVNAIAVIDGTVDDATPVRLPYRCQGIPTGQTAVARHHRSGTCTSSDPSDERERAGQSKSFNTRERCGASSQERRHHADTAAASVLAISSEAADATSDCMLGGMIAVLSAEEANALVALGRSAPDDPRVLLKYAAQSLQRVPQLLLGRADVVGKDCDIERSDAVGVFKDRGYPQDRILDQAVDKLVSELQEANSASRRVGMGPHGL